MDRMLTTDEAARRLGVKVPTLYAYVSRGLLESHRDPARRGQPLRPGRHRGPGGAQSRRAPDGDAAGHHHDGRDPAGPGARSRLPGASGHRAGAGVELRGGGRAAVAVRRGWRLVALPSSARAHSPRRSTACAGPSCCAAPRTPCGPTCARPRWRAPPAASPPRSTDVVGPAPAGGDCRCLHRGPPGGAPHRRSDAAVPAAAVNAALVLMADHELATSTMAVRVAASVRSDPYDALLAGLATLAGPLHGGASQQAYELLVVAERDGAARALERRPARARTPARVRALGLQERRPPLRRAAGAGRAAAERGAPRPSCAR